MAISCNTTLANSGSTNKQYIKVNLLGNHNYTTVKILIRVNAATGDGYVAQFSKYGNLIGMYYLAGWAVGGAVGTNGTLTWSGASNWIGVEVSGTGNSTVFSLWSWGSSDPGDWDAAHTTWGAATLTQTNDPSPAYDANTTVGLGSSDTEATDFFDNFYAGSSAS